MQIGYIGLGKMGRNMVIRLKEKGHDVLCFNRSDEGKEKGRADGLIVKNSIKELAESLSAAKTIWIMVSHQGVDEVIKELLQHLTKGDTIIDGGNCFYKDTIRRSHEIEKKGINFLDIGVSGGPHGARNGACLMIGGKKDIVKKYEKLYEDLSAPGAWRHFGDHGAGHFTKMVHNGIEYGMMQSIAEGFAILKKSDFNLDLKEVADLYNHRSVIESRLVGWLKDGIEKYSPELNGISGEVSASGEGEWTVKTAKEFGVPAPAIQTSLYFRQMSQGNPSFIGKLLSVMRNMFGGHDVREK